LLFKKNIKLVFSYDGTDFVGFQRQKKGRTVQGVLEEALLSITGENIKVYGSGRTDSGVHALRQVCNFYTSSKIPGNRFAYLLVYNLPKDIIPLYSDEVPFFFHARKSACFKTYLYILNLSPFNNILTSRYTLHYPFKLDILKMKEASSFLLGTHDFSSFCAKTNVTSFVRTIYSCEVKKLKNLVFIKITGNGFLRNMVRIIVGTLVYVGRGKIPVHKIPLIIRACDRNLAGPTFPSRGLFLLDVGFTPFEKDEE